ncbi:MAG: prepilin-type N-terminal cleavage/methylation domain-containing protein [Victivallales bacterium]|nr:prepilin-type N-terminal cleavage/methylation domain-containing protein [Victivallales bacterium]
MSRSRCGFTIIELLVSLAVIAMLSALLLPSLAESRAKARFIRWVQFNKQCSADPTCVINLDFQDGEGDLLKNSAQGHEGEGFNSVDYSGVVKGDYEWARGRWWKGKKALQFDGVSTYVEFPQIQHLDFGKDDSFTIIIWVKFDRLRRWDGLFSKSYWASPPNGYAQYDLYFDGTTYSGKTASGQFEVDVGCTCIGFDDVSEDGEENITLDTENWFQLTLRNKVTGEDNDVSVFFNGTKLKSRSSNFCTSTLDRCSACLVLGCIRWLVSKYNKETGTSEPTKEGKLDNFFKGKIDEFLVYGRALTDNEIKAHHAMGTEHH